MLKDLISKYYFSNNYNCAETLIHAGNDYYHLDLHENDMKMVAGFGAGMQTGNTCGAIIAGVSILSMLYVNKNAHESPSINKVCAKMIIEFKNRYNSLDCKVIRPINFKAEYRCLKTIEIAADIIEQIIDEYHDQIIKKEQ